MGQNLSMVFILNYTIDSEAENMPMFSTTLSVILTNQKSIITFMIDLRDLR